MGRNDPLRVAVTGGAGFIGSHLVERLLADGNFVRVIDNYASGRAENLAHLSHYRTLDVVEADIVTADLSRLFKGLDRVFHLAALADIVPSIQQPERYFIANVLGTLKVIQASLEAKISRFVYSASSSCYGIPDSYPTPESAEIRPQYPYALTKYQGEELVIHWSKIYSLPAVSLRLFNVYGPRSRTSGTYGAVFGVFLAQKLAGQPFTVVGDGAQTRDFTFVTDVVEAFVRAADSHLCGEVMNVGSGGTYSVNRLVEQLGGPITYIPKRPGEPQCTFADTRRIREKLGWKPMVSFEEGIHIMLQNIDYWRKAPVWTPDRIAQATKEWFECLT